MSVADEYKTESTGSGSFIKSSEFDNGLALEVVSMEKFTPDNSQYGVSNNYGAGGVLEKENWFIKEGILEEGQSFRYTFKTGDVVRTFENSSLGFYFKFTELNPDKEANIWIKREVVSQFKINWTIEQYHDQQGVTNEVEQEAMDNLT